MAEILKNTQLSEDIVYLHAVKPLVVESIETPLPVEEKPLPDLTAIFNQGLAEGVAQSTTQLQKESELLASLLDSIPQAIASNRLQLTEDIADIVLVIVQQFFINQQYSKEALAQQIQATIAQLNDKQTITLSLHPQDLLLLQKGQLPLDLKQYKNLRIMPDDSLRLGGCIITSDHGVFDASIEKQIDSLKQALLQIRGNHA